MAVCITIKTLHKFFDLMYETIEVAIARTASEMRGWRVSRGRRSRQVPGWIPRAGEPSHFSEKEYLILSLNVNLSRVA